MRLSRSSRVGLGLGRNLVSAGSAGNTRAVHAQEGVLPQLGRALQRKSETPKAEQKSTSQDCPLIAPVISHQHREQACASSTPLAPWNSLSATASRRMYSPRTSCSSTPQGTCVQATSTDLPGEVLGHAVEDHLAEGGRAIGLDGALHP